MTRILPIVLFLLLGYTQIKAQLYVAPGDSISVLSGTVFTVQDPIQNNGRVFGDGSMQLTGAAVQDLSGNGTYDKITVTNHSRLLNQLNSITELNLNAGALLELNHQKLVSSGTILGTGQFRGSSLSRMALNGTAQTASLYFDNSSDGSTNALDSLQIQAPSSTIQLQSKLYLYSQLNNASGTMNLQQELVLRSNAANTASVAPVGGTFTYTGAGNFVIERYIPGRRAWRLLTAPVTAASNVKISQAWQDGATPVSNPAVINASNNPNPGFGTHITFGLPAMNGYDQGVNGNTSIRYLIATGWNGVPSATNNGSVANSGTITDQPGYMLFVRGDRSTQLAQATSAATSPTVLRPKGKINTGTLNLALGTTFNNGFGGQFRVVANPYPAVISFHQLITDPVNTAAGFTDAFYLWDPAITGSNGVGGFVGLSYNAAASAVAGAPVYDRTTVVSGGGNSSIDNSGHIASGSAFVIDYGGASSTIRIAESHKTNAVNNLTQFRPAHQLQIQLLALNADQTTSVNDGALVDFNGNPSGSMRKMDNFSETITLLNGTEKQCLLRRNQVQLQDTIFLQTSRLKIKNYALELNARQLELPAGASAWLEDTDLGILQWIHPNEQTTYPFSVASVDQASHANRFRIIFNPLLRNTALMAEPFRNQIQVHGQWLLLHEAVQVILERSEDAEHFTPTTNLGQFALGTNLQQFRYSDEAVVAGKLYFYRLRFEGITSGAVTYSNIAQAQLAGLVQAFIVSPNPVVEDVIQLLIKTAANGKYAYQFLTADGRTIEIGTLSVTASDARISIPLHDKYPAGRYLLKLQGADHETYQLPVQLNPR